MPRGEMSQPHIGSLPRSKCHPARVELEHLHHSYSPAAVAQLHLALDRLFAEVREGLQEHRRELLALRTAVLHKEVAGSAKKEGVARQPPPPLDGSSPPGPEGSSRSVSYPGIEIPATKDCCDSEGEAQMALRDPFDDSAPSIGHSIGSRATRPADTCGQEAAECTSGPQPSDPTAIHIRSSSRARTTQSVATSGATSTLAVFGSKKRLTRAGSASESQEMWRAGMSESDCLLCRAATLIVKGRGGKPFDFFIGFVIAANALVIGLEIQSSKTEEGVPLAVEVLEHIFLLAFLVELLLRAAAGARIWRKDLLSGWFIFDLILVGIGITFSWLLVPIYSALQRTSSVDALDQFLILRIFRLMRLVRVLRLFEVFEDLWKLTNGLLLSAKTVLSAIVLMVVAVYVFACLGFEAISASESLRRSAAASAVVEQSFSSLQRTMLTLTRFILADSVGSVYEPIVISDATFGLFFAFCGLFISISMMNLVTAAIVNTAIALGVEDDKDRRRQLRKRVREMLPEIEMLFDHLDQDGSGFLMIEEIDSAKLDHKFSKQLQAVIHKDKLVDLFEFLDMDNSGSVDKDEFVDGVIHLMLQNAPFETSQTLQLLRRQTVHIATMQTSLNEISEALADPGASRAHVAVKTPKTPGNKRWTNRLLVGSPR